MSSAVHISLNVSDLDSSVAFYRRFFGEPRKLKADYISRCSREAARASAALSRTWAFGWIRVRRSGYGKARSRSAVCRPRKRSERPAATRCRRSSGSVTPTAIAGRSTRSSRTSNRRPTRPRPAVSPRPRPRLRAVTQRPKQRLPAAEGQSDGESLAVSGERSSYAGTDGSRTVKTLPCPGSPSTRTAPPWSWTMCLTIAKPRPVPGRLFDRDRSIW